MVQKRGPTSLLTVSITSVRNVKPDTPLSPTLFSLRCVRFIFVLGLCSLDFTGSKVTMLLKHIVTLRRTVKGNLAK